MTGAFARCVAVLGVSALLVAVAASCDSATTEVCNPTDEGFGSAVPLTVVGTLLEIEQSRECAPRVAVIRSQDELVRAFTEAQGPGGEDPPAVSFATEGVFLREWKDEQTQRWLVAQGDVATVGTQACSETPTLRCLVSIYRVAKPITQVKEHICPLIRCQGIGGVQQF